MTVKNRNKILLKNGLIVDPRQRLQRVCSLLVRDGQVAEITDEDREAEQVIDCRGKIVCPGFIDIHMHEDAYDPSADSFYGTIFASMVLMGVTTAIGGNCGSNASDPLLFLNAADRHGVPCNVGLLAGHTWLREKYSQSDKYSPAEADEIRKMTAEGRRLLDGGCLGISFGLKYVPGAGREEILPLAELCRRDDKLVAAHVRQDVEGVFSAAEELADVGRAAGVHVQFSHIGSMGGYGQMKELLSALERSQKDGADILCDCYPYDAFSTGIGETTYDEGFLRRYGADYDSILICSGKYNGMFCTEEMFRELRAEAPQTYTVGRFMKSEDVELALLSPLTMIASDGVRDGDEGHPRAAGTFPRVFDRYVKTGKMSLFAAVEKMTSMPAERLGLPKKGNLLPGSDADITVFDPEKIKDCATYEQPVLPPEGIECVIVGGRVAAERGELIARDAGRSVRR